MIECFFRFLWALPARAKLPLAAAVLVPKRRPTGSAAVMHTPVQAMWKQMASCQASAPSMKLLVANRTSERSLPDSIVHRTAVWLESSAEKKTMPAQMKLRALSVLHSTRVPMKTKVDSD